MIQKTKIVVMGLKGLPVFGGATTVGDNIIEQLKDKYDSLYVPLQIQGD
ncbi:MAG: hypothetical protein HXX14_11535 [Bacteroidetes bacterium]|nr:hypothetical protein [Bacteroidota bacterium]